MAALGPLGHLIDQELTQCRERKAIETARFRQASYVVWTISKKIPDPCGPQAGYQRIVAQFLKELFLNHNCRSATMRGYGDSINFLFHARTFPLPADFSLKENMSNIIYTNLRTEENIARQRASLTMEIFAQLAIDAENSHEDSAEAVVFDQACVNKVSGNRLGEYGQKTQTRIEVH